MKQSKHSALPSLSTASNKTNLHPVGAALEQSSASFHDKANIGFKAKAPVPSSRLTATTGNSTVPSSAKTQEQVRKITNDENKQPRIFNTPAPPKQMMAPPAKLAPTTLKYVFPHSHRQMSFFLLELPRLRRILNFAELPVNFKPHSVDMHLWLLIQSPHRCDRHRSSSVWYLKLRAAQLRIMSKVLSEIVQLQPPWEK